MGKDYSDKNTGEDLTLKQMFDISEKLIVEQSHGIFGVSQTSREDSSWNLLSLVNDEDVISLSHAKVYVCLGKVNQKPTSNSFWEKLSWFKSPSQYKTLDTIDGEPMKFEWNIFPGFTTFPALQQSPRVLVANERSIRISRTNHLHVDVR